MKYNFDKIPSREGTSCYKYDKRTEIFGRDDVIPMWVADMDFEVAPYITEAIKQRAEHALYGYEFHGDRYHEAIVNWISLRNGWNIERGWIEFTPGVVSGLALVVRALTRAGEGVVIQPPIYPPFAQIVKSSGRKLLNNPLLRNGDTHVIDFNDLDKQLSKARLLMLCNPHNPTGRVFTEEELLKVGELCKKHGAYIVSDEIHSDLIRKEHKHRHIASLSEDLASRTITLIAPSKTFNIAGLTTSAAIIPSPDLHRLFTEETSRSHSGDGNAFGSVALEAAYSKGGEWVDQLNDYLAGNIDYVKKFIAEKIPSVKAFHGGGTYLIWLDFSEWGMGRRKLNDFLVNKARLGLSSGLEFGREGRVCARMNIGTSRAVVEQAMEQLYRASRELGL